MAVPNSTVDIELQKNTICKLLNQELKKGDTWYLINSKWLKLWKKYVGYDLGDTWFVGKSAAYPGVIDNCVLLQHFFDALKENLIEGHDYQLIPEKAWNLFVSWYSLRQGQKPIARKVIELGNLFKTLKVEIYLISFQVCFHSSLDKVVAKSFSCTDTIKFVRDTLSVHFDVMGKTGMRLLYKHWPDSYKVLDDVLESTIQDAGLYQGQTLVLEVQNTDGSWPLQSKLCNNLSESAILRTLEESKADSIEELITCAVCISVMTDPRTLPCLHSFCNDCLQRLNRVIVFRKNGITCPSCRSFTTYDNIKTNFVVTRLIEMHNKKEEKKGKTLCVQCRSECATAKCRQCEILLCKGCQISHKDIPACESHIIEPYNGQEGIKPGNSPTASNNDKTNLFCSIHKDCEVQARCVTCDINICYKCKFETHDTHPSKSINRVVQESLPKVKEILKNISQRADLKRKQLSKVQRERELMNENVKIAKMELELQREVVHAAVDDGFMALYSEIDNIIDKPKQELTAVESIVKQDIKEKNEFVANTRNMLEKIEGVRLMKAMQETERKGNEMLGDESELEEMPLPIVAFETSDFGLDEKILLGKVAVYNRDNENSIN